MSWRDPDASRLVGRKVPRVDGPAKVRGQARYTYDVRLPGMLYGRLLTSPHAHCKIKSMDLGAVRKMPGVKCAIGQIGRELRFQGEWVAAVAAETDEQAEDALKAIRVEYEVLPFVPRVKEGLLAGAPAVFAGQSNLRADKPNRRGDPAAALARATVVVDLTVQTPCQVHACLEPHGVVADWQPDGSLTVYASTQGISSTQEALATYLELPAAKVRVVCEHMGGGFGSKMGATAVMGLTCKLAREAKAPVKLMLDRATELVTGGNRPPSFQLIRAGATEDGTLSGLAIGTEGSAGVGTGSAAFHPYLYRVADFHVEHVEVRTHMPPSCAFRAPAMPQGCVAMEATMDALADALGMDPLELRKQNDDSETRRAQYDLGAKAIGWSERAAKPGAGAGPIKRGYGMAASLWWGNGGKGNTVTVVIAPDGAVQARAATQDIGTGTRTLVAAIVAEELGLPIEAVDARIGDTAFGQGTGSGGSTTAASVAPAALVAARKARERLLETLAAKLAVPAEKLELADGRLKVGGDKPASMPFAKAASLLGGQPLEVAGEWEEGLSGMMVGGCQFAKVAVDTRTGKVTVEKIVAVQDCGKVLDRLTCETQVHGGVIQGLSFALLEQRIVDPRLGRMINQGLEDYRIAGYAEVPPIEVILQDMPERGVIGIGEPATIPTAAAILNAVNHALGVRITALPLTPARVLEALVPGLTK